MEQLLMSTHVVIAKKPSGHNLQVVVTNPGDSTPRKHVLSDGQFIKVMVYGNGTIEMQEVEKAAAAIAAVPAVPAAA
jgi:hypothetical protein